MALFRSVVLPAVALGAGTWLGMGGMGGMRRPSTPGRLGAAAAAAERTAASVAASVAASFAGAVRVAVSGAGASTEEQAPPLDRTPSAVDASAIPDPPLPWPRLNPEDRAERAWLLAEGPWHAPTDGRRLVTFTFDDGPIPEIEPTLLRILAMHRIRATFFFIGEYLEGDGARAAETREWARRIAEAGHFVGNHTRDHKPLTALSHAEALAEIDDSADAIERAVGRRPFLFRPPYGALDPWLESALRERQQELVLWSIDVEDMKKDDPDAIVDALEAQLERAHGGVVLLHDVHWPSVKAFNRLVRWLESNRWDPTHPDRAGWDIVDLPTYVRATAASPQPYATREDLERAREGLPARPRGGAAVPVMNGPF